MRWRRSVLAELSAVTLVAALAARASDEPQPDESVDEEKIVPVVKTDAQWRKELTAQQFKVKPTGLRNCMNSAALKFERQKTKGK